MICVIQRVSRAAVVAGPAGAMPPERPVYGKIDAGMAVLAAVQAGDTAADIDWVAGKLLALRIFPSVDNAHAYDRNVIEAGGGVLLVSNFTIAAETAQGRRPSLSGAAPPGEAAPLFDRLVEAVRAGGAAVETGRFGANMVVSLDNVGPCTFLLDSRRGRRQPAPG